VDQLFLLTIARSFGPPFSKGGEFLRQSLKSPSAEGEILSCFKQTAPRRLFGRSKIFPSGEIFAPSLYFSKLYTAKGDRDQYFPTFGKY